MNLILYAIPVFFVCIAIEVLVNARMGKDVYRLNDAINDLSCGVFEQVAHHFTKLILFYNFYWVSNNFAIFHIESQAWYVWVFLFFAIDFCYYCFHRCSHRVNLVWATHIVHHQSEEYNLAVALRQGAF